MSDPGDVSSVRRLLDEGLVEAEGIVAILGKTEGNGCVNDFTRPYAVSALLALLSERMHCPPDAVAARIAIIMSGGTEGGLSPHFLIFSVAPSEIAPSGLPTLATGTAFTREFAPEEIGRLSQVEETAAAVRLAMSGAGISDPEDVHYVQVKCPLLTSGRVAAAAARGKTVVTDHTYSSMGFSRAASALGVACALRELELPALTQASIGHDLSLWSGRASTSAGIELMRNEILVLGNSVAWAGNLRIAHAVMRDAIDLDAVQSALLALEIPASRQLAPADAARVRAVLAKAEPSRSGQIRGSRHIMWDDSDINATRHARALVGGVVAGLIGRTDLFISGGAEHQGPDGGGPIAIIADRSP
nr:ring-opening amidohydrolase [uncultured Lichenicoccus sp.]